MTNGDNNSDKPPSTAGTVLSWAIFIGVVVVLWHVVRIFIHAVTLIFRFGMVVAILVLVVWILKERMANTRPRSS